MKKMIINIMQHNYQTIHASLGWYFLHKKSDSCGDSGNIKKVHNVKTIINDCLLYTSDAADE